MQKLKSEQRDVSAPSVGDVQIALEALGFPRIELDADRTLEGEDAWSAFLQLAPDETRLAAWRKLGELPPAEAAE